MFGSNFRDFVSLDTTSQSQLSSERLIKSWNGFEKSDSGDSGNCSETEEEQSTNRAAKLEFQLTQPLLSGVKVNEGNKDANSGKQAQLDLDRMNFVINGRTINKEYVRGLYRQYNHLISNGNENYRLFAKQVFTEMFKHAEAEVPDDHILEELITHCNQAGYEFAVYEQIQLILAQYNLMPTIPEKTISLCCNSADSVSVEYSDVIVVKNPDQPEQYESGSKLEFALKFQNGEIEYENGKVTLTIPEQLKNYKANDKSLLDDINEHFKDADNAVVECLMNNIGDGPKSFVVEGPTSIEDGGASSQVLDSTESNETTDTNPGIISNVISTLAGVAEVGIGIATEYLYPQDQINVEPRHDEEEFTIPPKSLTFNELVDIINKAKNGDCKYLDEVVSNIKEAKEDDRAITLDRDNLRDFCSQQLNLTAQTDHHRSVREMLIKKIFNGENGSCYYSVKELVLLTIAANDTLVEKYARTHKDILFTQDEDLDKLLIGVGGQCYIKFLLEYLEEKLDSILPWYDICKNLERALSVDNQGCVKAVLDKFKDTEAESRAPDISSKLLHYAIHNNYKDVAKSIIEYNPADINSVDNLGNAALHWAVARNNSKLISLLIQNGAEVDIKDEKYGRTALHWAAYHGEFEIVELLVKEGADWNIKDRNGKTALDLVGTRPKLSQERDTLPTSELKITKFLEGLGGKTPLHHAVENKNSDTAEKLLAKGADINAKDSGNWTPLSRAIISGDLKLVTLLLNHGADANVEIQYGCNTHLSWAIQRNGACESSQTWEIIELLLEKKVRIGKKELEEAIRVGNPKIVELLVNKGAVITKEIVGYAKKTIEDCVEGRSHTIGYPGGLEGEKQVRAEILGFLEDKFSNMQLNSDLVDESTTPSQAVDEAGDKQSQNPEPKSQQPEKNIVDNGKNIMNNGVASKEKPIGNNREGGEMHDSGQSTKSIKERLSDAIWDINFEEAKRLVEQGGDDITQIVLSEALEEARQTEVDKKDKKSKSELIEIREFLEEKLKNIGDNVAASSVGGEDVGATTSSQEEKPAPDQLTGQMTLQTDDTKLESDQQSASHSSKSSVGGNESNGNSSSTGVGML